MVSGEQSVCVKKYVCVMITRGSQNGYHWPVNHAGSPIQTLPQSYNANIDGVDGLRPIYCSEAPVVSSIDKKPMVCIVFPVPLEQLRKDERAVKWCWSKCCTRPSLCLWRWGEKVRHTIARGGDG